MDKKVLEGAAKRTRKGPITRAGIAKELSLKFDLTETTGKRIIDSLAILGVNEVIRTGHFMFPGLFRIKSGVKPATKACVKKCFGKYIEIPAKPERRIVKTFPALGLNRKLKPSQ